MVQPPTRGRSVMLSPGDLRAESRLLLQEWTMDFPEFLKLMHAVQLASAFLTAVNDTDTADARGVTRLSDSDC